MIELSDLREVIDYFQEEVSDYYIFLKNYSSDANATLLVLVDKTENARPLSEIKVLSGLNRQIKVYKKEDILGDIEKLVRKELELMETLDLKARDKAILADYYRRQFRYIRDYIESEEKEQEDAA